VASCYRGLNLSWDFQSSRGPNLVRVTTPSPSLIDLFDGNEGNQQEQLCVWLTDNLQPSGVYHSPQIPKGSGTRELTDILLSHRLE
jgi:hypothetical protein